MTEVFRPRNPPSRQVSSLLLFLLVSNASAVSLSDFQKIKGFSTSCENVWTEEIPGCTIQDFAGYNDCSRSCLAGVDFINVEVLTACSADQAQSGTLLGNFLNGNGVAALCGVDGTTTSSTMSAWMTSNSQKTSSTKVSSWNADSTTIPTVLATTTMRDTTVWGSSRTSTITTTASTHSAQPVPQSVTTASATTSSSPTQSDLTISFSDTTTKPSITSKPSTTTSTTTSTSNPETKGFGGVGSAFDILGGESNAPSRADGLSLIGITLAAVILLVVRGDW